MNQTPRLGFEPRSPRGRQFSRFSLIKSAALPDYATLACKILNFIKFLYLSKKRILMEPLFHIIIPTLLLLVFFPKLDKKMILMLSPFSIITDLSHFIPGTHRVVFYNIFFLTLILLIVFIMAGKLPTLIAGYFLVSHYLLDLGEPGIAFFWPLTNNLYYLKFQILEKLGQWSTNIYFGVNAIGGGLRDPLGKVVDTWGFLATFIVLITFAISYYIKRKHYKSK